MASNSFTSLIILLSSLSFLSVRACDTNEVFISETQACYPIPSSNNSWACEWDAQCRATAGKYSRCRLEIGRCECHDTDRKYRGVLSINNTCHIKLEIGGICTSDLSCQQSIPGQSYCIGLTADPNSQGICNCAHHHYFDKSLEECLKYGTPGSACKTHFQCNQIQAMGKLSRCSPVTKLCECWDTENDIMEPTGFYQGKCYYSRQFNEPCTFREECIVGYHKNANCLLHETYRNETVCQCTEGEKCEIYNNNFHDYDYDNGTGQLESSVFLQFLTFSFAIFTIVL